MAQPFKEFLTKLADPDPSFDDLRARWAAAPYATGKEEGLTNPQVGIAREGSLRDIQRALENEAEADPEGGTPGLAKRQVIIDN